MNNLTVSRHKMIWPNILFFGTTTLVAILGGPLYVARFGIHPFTLGLTLFYFFATSMSITAGYHRLFSHAAYKTHPVLQFLFLFFGAAAYEQSALNWSSEHRRHHLYVDTERDPYSIKKGFFYAHIGWLLFWEHPENYDNSKDLQKNRLVMHQHKYYFLWAAVSGIIFPMLIGLWYGDLLGAFIFAVCSRLVLAHHATFAINSVCHTFGKSTYDIHSTAKDHWLVALVTNGEGYHNFHHHFPNDYRNGVRWYQWDPTKWLIAAFSKLGLARDLRRVSAFRIIAAKLAADHQRAEEQLQHKQIFNKELLNARLRPQYEKLKQKLVDWETAARDYQALLRERIECQSERMRQAAAKKMEMQHRFKEALHEWKTICLKLRAV